MCTPTNINEINVFKNAHMLLDLFFKLHANVLYK